MAAGSQTPGVPTCRSTSADGEGASVTAANSSAVKTGKKAASACQTNCTSAGCVRRRSMVATVWMLPQASPASDSVARASASTSSAGAFELQPTPRTSVRGR